MSMAEGFRSTYIEKAPPTLPLIKNIPRTQYARSRIKESPVTKPNTTNYKEIKDLS